MKNSIMLISLFAVLLSNPFSNPAYSQENESPSVVMVVNGPKIEFESETIDYGTIEHKADGKRAFHFTNTGNEPLIIKSAKGSCGCTVPTYPKEPIAPGESAVIEVKYATDRVGSFRKTVTLTTNVDGPNKVLTIQGKVLPDPPAPGADDKGDSEE